MQFYKIDNVLKNINLRLILIFALGLSFSIGVALPIVVYGQDFESELTGPMINNETTEPQTSSSFQNNASPEMFVKITSHKSAQKVDSGTLEVLGISSDNNSRDCIVEMDWNNEKPGWIVTPTGPGGEGDFSTWSFTYDINTHEIKPGTNDLTSKLTCTNPGPLTKWYSVTLIGNPYPIPRPLPVP
jgi:hypothetical protein